MEDKYSDFLLLLDIEKIDYIVTDSDFSIIEDHSRDSAALKNVSKKTLKELSAQEAAGTAYTAELSLFVFKEKTACVFVDNSSLTSGFSNYLFIISSMLRTIDESVLILDSENRIEFINHSFRDNYDYSIDEIRDMLITEIVNPQYIEQILGILKSKTETTVEAEIYSNAGKSLPVIIDICALGSKKLILVKDKQEEEIYSREIEGLKRMQKMVFDSIGQGILVLDRNGGVLQFNQFMEQKYRFTRSKMIGRNIFDIVTDLSELKPVFRDVVEDKKVKKVTNMKRFSHRLNEELVQNFYGYPLIENNEAVGVVVVIEDLTEKKQLEDEYESTRKRNEMINALNMILSRGLQIDFVLKEIGDYILSRTSAERITVYDKQQSKFIELKKSKDRVTHRVLPDSRGMLSAVSKVSDEIHIVRKKERIVEITGRKTPAELCVFPLYFNDNLLSYFILESNKKGSFENQMEFLSGIKEYAVHIIDKAIIYEEKLSNLQKLELTLKISRLLSRTKEPKKAFEGLITILSSQINADNALLMIKSEDDEELMIQSIVGEDADNIDRDDIDTDKLHQYFSSNSETVFINDLDKEDKNNTCSCFSKIGKSVICSPIRYKNELLGIVVFINKAKNSFRDNDFDLINIIATSSSSYLKNLHLQMKMAQKIEQLSVLYKISTSIRPVINYTFLKKAVISSLGSLSRADFVLMLTRTDSTYNIEHSYFKSIDLKKRFTELTDLPDDVIDSGGRSIRHYNNQSRLCSEIFPDKLKGATLLRVKTSRETITILSGYTDRFNRNISDETYMAIMNELSISFENSILFDQNEKRLKQFSSIGAITKKLAHLNIQSLDEYYQYIVDAARELIHCEYASLLMKTDNILQFKAVAGIDIDRLSKYDINIGEGIAGYVAQTGEPVIENDTSQSEHFKELEFSSVYSVRNLVNIPLKYKDRVIGVLCADNKLKGQFDQNDVVLMKILANSTLIAFEHFMDIDMGARLSDIILDTIPSGVIYIDKDGHVQYINEGFIKISGYTHERIFNKHFTKIFTDDNNIIARSIEKSESAMRKEVELIKNDREKIPCGISITPVKSNDNVDIVAIIQDLSEIKSMRRELKDKENLALLGQMAAGMAHEIKNPIAGILTGLEFLYMQIAEKNDTHKQSLEMVIKEVKRLDRLVNDMTSFAKSKVRILSEVNIEKLVERAIHLAKDKSQIKEIDIITDFPDNIQKMRVDEEQILEVLLNIILNANQAIEENGKIEINVKQDNDRCIISVKNDGPPIPGDVIDKIFTPFFTTKSGGTGLGLAISYTIVKEHKGRMTVQNTDEGVEFKIILPLRDESYA